ncbi:hypothetical protein F4810DRAFT_505711 [Camillea tinctor]|nr:hypothetical protein F4810DRAFT_505711 [Camillea tinctor]
MKDKHMLFYVSPAVYSVFLVTIPISPHHLEISPCVSLRTRANEWIPSFQEEIMDVVLEEAAADRPSAFPLFSNLSPELRNQIWRDALPTTVGPSLCFYKKGLWRPRQLTASEERYDPENEEFNLVFEFRYDLLDAPQFEVPLALVNREARSIALPWLREHGVETRPREGGQDRFFLRPFNLERDALYVPAENWEEFVAEPLERPFEADLVGRHMDVVPYITRLAVPGVLLDAQMNYLDEVFRSFYRLEVLFVVCNSASQDIRDADGQWELMSGDFTPLVWDPDRKEFSPKHPVREGDRAQYPKMEAAGKIISDALVQNHMHNFEIQPCDAVMR